MKQRFDIRSQLGYARLGRIKIGERSFKTPNLLVPANKNILNKIQMDESFNFFDSIQSKDNFNKLIGYEIQDPLGIFTEKENKKEEVNSSLFSETKELWGIPRIPLRPKNTTEDQIENTQKLYILADNYPNTDIARYRSYELAATSTRLRMYEELLLKKYPDNKFILEFTFKEDPQILKYIITWILRNQEHLFGIRIRNIFANLMQSRIILKWIIELKKKLPSNLLWIVGGKILPQNYALALYLGFDLIDTRYIFQMGIKGLYISPNSTKWLRELSYPLCSCKFCQQIIYYLDNQKKETSHVKSLILNHNFYSAIGELWRIKQSITDKTLRSYIEMKIHSSPLAAAFLRTIDNQYAKEINSRFPIINSHPVMCVGSESYNRPEIINFINRVKDEITPAKNYKMVVILPCSAKKPYSQSRSHQKFIKTIRKAAGKLYNEIHQVIITSPTGVIPRELEKVFPAAHYDIPVTGEWDAHEIRSTAECLANWLKKYETEDNSSLTIIAHLTGGYRKACEIAELFLSREKDYENRFNFIYSITQNDDFGTGSFEGLNNLTSEITENLSKIAQDKKSPDKSNDYKKITKDEIIIKATMDYQFGKGAGDMIIKNGAIIIKGKRPQYNEIYTYDGAGKLLVGRLYTNTGLIKLAPRGAELLVPFGKHQISIKEENLQGTTIFRPILDLIDPLAHPGDDMIVVNKNGNYLGVGELIQAPSDAILAKSGMICKLRKKIKQHSIKGQQK
jgi:archaeosine synthase